ncbi:hypothetical protein D9756_002107 [Leucocoprinus leucothites]|uniref:Uncharacterized protein n=1 Tax=Leucocoprinus leucothites TaxID=201217 RepID=A0A8H5LM58_9AGAR|nr:hypothetical protein D9756_002107 [Leucoagaricus leucothites]
MYHCWDRKYGTPLPITRQVLPGDVGNFDRSGNFGVFFNIYDSGRGALPLKDPSPPIDCDIQETYIGDSSTRLLNIVLVSHPAHPSNYRLFLKGGSTRFMFLVPDASQKAFKNPSVVREYANAQSALWYKHVASVFGFENMDLVLIESVVESSTRTYFASCPISTSKSNPEAPIILALATGDINMSLHNTENNEDHYLLHQLAPKNSPAGPHVAYVGAIPLPKPSLNR